MCNSHRRIILFPMTGVTFQKPTLARTDLVRLWWYTGRLGSTAVSIDVCKNANAPARLLPLRCHRSRMWATSSTLIFPTVFLFLEAATRVFWGNCFFSVASSVIALCEFLKLFPEFCLKPFGCNSSSARVVQPCHAPGEFSFDVFCGNWLQRLQRMLVP